MKKIYFAPEVKTYKVQSSQIMELSLSKDSTDTMYSKQSIFDVQDDNADADYINIGFDIYKVE